MALDRRENTHDVVASLKRLLCMFLLCIYTSTVNGVHKSESRQVRLIVTSDQHGWMSTSLMYPKQKRKGLLHISQGIREARLEDPELILLDAGDLLHGSPLVTFIHKTRTDPAAGDPFFDLVQSLGYDAVAVGNHDLGINPFFEKFYMPKSNFTWLAANLVRDSELVFKPYIILRRFGLKIAILGFSTPGSQMWLAADQLNGIESMSIESSAAFWLQILRQRENPDLIIGLFHSGVYQLRDDENSKLNRIAPANSVVETLNQNSGFDLAITGHDHRLSSTRNGAKIKHIRGTPIIEGGKWGEAFVDLKLVASRFKKKWRITDVKYNVYRASQDRKIESKYVEQLPNEYMAYIHEPLPYIFTRTDKKSALKCLNLLNAMAQDESSILGSMLPNARIYRLTDFIGQRVRRKELYKWLRHDNRTVTVMLSERDIQLLKTPEWEYGRRRIPGNRMLYSHLKKMFVDSEEESWWLNTQRFKRIYRVKISDYHDNGGGGAVTQVFLPADRKSERSKMSVRDRLFAFMQQRPILPEVCDFLKTAGLKSGREAMNR